MWAVLETGSRQQAFALQLLRVLRVLRAAPPARAACAERAFVCKRAC